MLCVRRLSKPSGLPTTRTNCSCRRSARPISVAGNQWRFLPLPVAAPSRSQGTANGHTESLSSGVDTPGPESQGARHHTADFLGIEGCRQDVVSTQIEHLGPEVLIGEPRCDDESRGMSQIANLFKQEFPVPVGQVALAKYDTDSRRFRFPPGLCQPSRTHQGPRHRIRQRCQGSLIGPGKAHGQNHIGAAVGGMSANPWTHLGSQLQVSGSHPVRKLPPGWYSHPP